MRSAIPYDSDKGRNIAAALTSLMTGISYETSSEMAREVGPFPRWEANKSSMAEVIGFHRVASKSISYWGDFSGDELSSAIERVWESNTKSAYDVGFRNAQATLIAPTGTIGMLMDCDTNGCEPELSLVRFKAYAGGGNDKIVNTAVLEGLERLGYKEDFITRATDSILKDGSVPEGIRGGLADNELAIFDCAMSSNESGRYLRPLAHVEMLAAITPFLSGAASKTVNLPEHATVEDFDSVHRAAHRMGVKAVALYRNNSKLTQPVTTMQAVKQPSTGANGDVGGDADLEGLVEQVKKGEISINQARASLNGSHGNGRMLMWGERRQPPDERRGITQKFRVNDQVVYVRTGQYDDGTLAEIFCDMGKDGSMLMAMFGQFAKAWSLARQYGAPVDKLVESFLHTRFEPAGFVQGNPQIKSCSSVIDLIMRYVGLRYLNRQDLANVPASDPAMHFNVASFASQEEQNSLTLLEEVLETQQRAGIEVEENPRFGTVHSGNACGVCGEQMNWDGTCLSCPKCGNNTGCGGG